MEQDTVTESVDIRTVGADAEAIMRQIRDKMRERRAQVQGLDYRALLERTSPPRLDKEFYSHLEQLGSPSATTGVELSLTDPSRPLLGPLVQRVRTAAHNLSVYYVNMLAAQQNHLNRHVARVLTALVRRIEEDTVPNEVRDLRQELSQVRAQVEQLQAVVEQRTNRWKLAFVVPRYGEEILGGAEGITRSLAEHLPRPEFDVEVLTTCVQDTGSCENVYPAGLTEVNQVRVRRFPVDVQFRDMPRYHELLAKFNNRMPTTVGEEEEWIDLNIHSPALYTHIARHGQDYDFLIFGPYLFGTTFYGTALWPERSIVWPHLHDEPFARFLQTRLMLESCRGVMFNTEPEAALARYGLGMRNPRAFVVGEGMDSFRAEPERFRQRWGLSEPFVLYAGRLELMKNVLELVKFFVEYKQQRPGPLKLVLMGYGPLEIPSHPDVVPIGFQSERDKLDVYAAATALAQPSLMESFSLVLMESWLAGVPVLVQRNCEVTRYHVLRSNGGLCYEDAEEFGAAVDWLLEHPAERVQMGRMGQDYVLREYNWEAVLDRFRSALAFWRRSA